MFLSNQIYIQSTHLYSTRAATATATAEAETEAAGTLDREHIHIHIFYYIIILLYRSDHVCRMSGCTDECTYHDVTRSAPAPASYAYVPRYITKAC